MYVTLQMGWVIVAVIVPLGSLKFAQKVVSMPSKLQSVSMRGFSPPGIEHVVESNELQSKPAKPSPLVRSPKKRGKLSAVRFC